MNKRAIEKIRRANDKFREAVSGMREGVYSIAQVVSTWGHIYTNGFNAGVKHERERVRKPNKKRAK